MRTWKILSTVVLAAALTGCGDDDDNGGTPDGGGNTADAAGADATGGGFTQPSGTVPVNFGPVDDTANKVYDDGDLEWKGSMMYDSATRKVTFDSTWAGPWAPLYDDGPWNAGGHEPIGQTAGDNKWSVTVFATPPATGMQTYEYGLIDRGYETDFGNGWIWLGSNGTYNVAAGATTAVNAQGMTIPAFGTKDLQIKVDTNDLGPGTWDTSMVRIKSSAWGWSNQAMVSSSGIATFTLSDIFGPGKAFARSGLLRTGDKPEFIIVFGPGDGVEYKTGEGVAQTEGVTAGVRTGATGDFAPATITVLPSNNNTSVTIP
jgi:hypothetical protein